LTKPFPHLSECDREPIHIPGSIQPHGVMLVAESATLIVRYIGGDVAKMLGIDAGVDRPLAEFVGQANAQMAERVTKTATKRAFIGTIETADHSSINITSHLTGGYLIVELEPKAGPEKSSAELLGALEFASAAFDQASTLKALCDAAAIEFRKLTGYDRVMVYRFLDDAAGEVVAEDRRLDMHSFLNHHFPASDIPQQARALYIRNLLRVIPDVNYVAAVLQPEWKASAPLDMGDSILRSVSPIHLQYLRNMGVAASASISIVKEGVLWGLIACHNETPRVIPYDLRAACRTLAGNLARQIKTREETDAYRERLRIRGSEDETIALLSRAGALEEIEDHLDELSRLLSGDGFAVVRGRRMSLSGACPSEQEVSKLAAWLTGRSAETIFATNQLANLYPAAKSFEDVAAGVLALLLSAEEPWLLIWFRAEEIQTVNWAGNPHKAVDLKPGEILNPRTSFQAWQETVRGRARRWTLVEMEAAARIRHDLIEVRQNYRLKEVNRQLTETVAEKNLLLDQKQFLIGEVNHRVQNSLQLVSGFLSFQARESGDAQFTAAVEEARRRIMAVSLLHRSLYRGDQIGVTDGGRYIEELCENLIASIGPQWKPYFSLRLGPVMLPIDRVVPLGLVVTELVINITKYAYADGAAGPVEVGLTEHAGKFNMVVADKGAGRTSTRRGFGTRMMTALVTQLGGELAFEDNEPGLRAVLTAPILQYEPKSS
jgi:two-component system, chemotaxis family, sensor kinase Cph1